MKDNWLWSYRPINVLTLFVTIVLCLLALPLVVFAEEAAPTTPDMTDFMTALAANNWPLAVGLGLTIVVWIVRGFKLLERVPKNALPWVSLIVAVAGTAGTRIVQFCSESRPWWQGMIQGIFEGLSMGFISMGMWDTKQTVAKRKSK